MTRSPSAAVARRLDSRGIHYGWVIAGVSFLTLVTAAGFRSTVGVLIVPLQDEFGERRNSVGDGDRRGPIQDHAHRAFHAVLPHEKHAAAEVRVGEGGTGDEELATERFHDCIVTDATTEAT